MRKISPKLQIVIFSSILLIILGIVIFRTNIWQDTQIEQCSRSENQQKCWRDLIIGTFNRKGLDKSLDLIETIYESNPEFISVCHDFGHLLGRETYKSFRSGEELKINSKTSFCSYGFYHGLMEEMARSESDLSRVRDFCDYVDAQIVDQSPDATLQCFHGIGHGWVNVHDEPELWGDALGIAQRGINLCEQVSQNESELSRCATGVFNGIAFFYINKEYELEVDREDPLWLCRIQEEQYKDPCYLSFNVTLMNITDGNLLKAAKFIEAIPEDDYARHAMLNLAVPFGLMNIEGANREGIGLCRQVQSRLIEPCIQGYAFAFLEHGEPGKEYAGAINTCIASDLTAEEEGGCLSYIFNYLPQWYSEDRAYAICETLDTKYQAFCSESVREQLSRLN